MVGELDLESAAKRLALATSTRLTLLLFYVIEHGDVAWPLNDSVRVTNSGVVEFSSTIFIPFRSG